MISWSRENGQLIGRITRYGRSAGTIILWNVKDEEEARIRRRLGQGKISQLIDWIFSSYGRRNKTGPEYHNRRL